MTESIRLTLSTQPKTKTEQVDIVFPVYRKLYVGEDTVLLSKQVAAQLEIEVTIKHGNVVAMAIDTEHMQDNMWTIEHALGTGKYHCHRSEYEKAVTEFVRLVAVLTSN